jgi:hypothetical protein
LFFFFFEKREREKARVPWGRGKRMPCGEILRPIRAIILPDIFRGLAETGDLRSLVATDASACPMSFLERVSSSLFLVQLISIAVVFVREISAS